MRRGNGAQDGASETFIGVEQPHAEIVRVFTFSRHMDLNVCHAGGCALNDFYLAAGGGRGSNAGLFFGELQLLQRSLAEIRGLSAELLHPEGVKGAGALDRDDVLLIVKTRGPPFLSRRRLR